MAGNDTKDMSGNAKMAPDILTIIVTWNKKNYVLSLLESLRAQSFPRHRLDILVVDNASTDGTKEAVEERFPGVTILVNEKNLGGTGGFNRGFEYVLGCKPDRYKYVWLLDNDVVVHRDALLRLVDVLDSHPSVAACGSTMMQLDFPWRINEIGAFVDLMNGRLILNRHMFEIPAWQGMDVDALKDMELPPLSRFMPDCPDMVDVDYAAAASLLVRESVVREIGKWKDFFLHFDDVDWCLRIRTEIKKRVVVSTRSLIWHLSAHAKVPTWVHYYDTRNMLYVVKTHGKIFELRNVVYRFLKKSVFYFLIGKPEIAGLILDGIEDFLQEKTGKADIKLPWPYRELDHGDDNPLIQKDVSRILASPTVNFWSTGLHKAVTEWRQSRPGGKVEVLSKHGHAPVYWIPDQGHLFMPGHKAGKMWWLIRHFRDYPLVIQSDYAPLLILPLLGKEIMCLNDYGYSIRPAPSLQQLARLVRRCIGLRQRLEKEKRPCKNCTFNG